MWFSAEGRVQQDVTIFYPVPSLCSVRSAQLRDKKFFLFFLADGSTKQTHKKKRMEFVQHACALKTKLHGLGLQNFYVKTVLGLSASTLNSLALMYVCQFQTHILGPTGVLPNGSILKHPGCHA